MTDDKKKMTAHGSSVGADDGQSISTNSKVSIPVSGEEINDEIVNSPERLEEMYRRMQRMADPRYLHTLTMTELFQTTYKSRPPVAEGLLYAGAYILAGAPKIGKSFLVAQIAYHVSTGQNLWGYKVHQGTVLYLALEDDFQRIQSRMFMMYGVSDKVDVILFVADDECMIKLHQYAEARFHRMNDDYRRYFATITSEDIRRQYDRVVSDGDVVSKHNFRLPETIQVPHESGGKEYRNHLFVSEDTGIAKLKLNPWESGVLEEEQGRKDFVCWIRNPSRGSWALCIPYEMDGETKPTYPDIIIVRTDKVLGYVIDILEPHNPAYKDNLGKAKGFAEYARQNPGVGRIQLIRMSEDAAKNKRFKRLDMSKSAIRDKVSHATSNDELDHIFDTDGFFADLIED